MLRADPGEDSLDSALSNYAKVIQINPNNAGAYYNSGAIYKSRGDTAKGNQFIKKGGVAGVQAVSTGPRHEAFISTPGTLRKGKSEIPA